MRLVIDARVLGEKAQSGITHYARELIRHLSPLVEHDEVTLFSSGMRGPVSVSDTLLKKHLRVPNKILGVMSVVLGIPRIDRIAGGAEAVFLSNLHFANVSRTCKLIVTVHDLSFHHFPSMYSLRGRLWHVLVRPLHLLSRADAVITPSEATKRDLVEVYKLDAGRIHVIPPGIDLSPYEETSEHAAVEMRSRLGVMGKYILGIGGFDERKNISAAVEAYKRMPETIRKDVAMVIIGQTLWREHRSERARILTTPGVRFLGFVSEAEKIALLKGAVALVYPSLYEGFGFPILEGFAAGTPVVTSNVASLPEVAGDAALLVDPLKPDEIAASLTLIINDAALSARLCEAGKKRVREFSWDRTATATYDIIKDAVHTMPI
ncbi:MAG: hypothetical protein A2898_02775 [Candidatus Kerfeldbacteria bacterium RIFCSPLOWO2_01_FULL_48_11]|uniref:Glycosyl transferase family 1 domain-containing protein n=1 Tax=Candidatus Kerfeldbacteria bacterium RIFCSPLOWO2_01_FULL_48_11 TaxID=1798543 RepID=A0A1G2B9T8_9BACT|nr:MAG: Glycosyl transferase, group 1 [Parcubacteria group bacterium GW2011_GWA2_48_9]KKW13918.1 MAG: Glycosyl transferase, group 1 [Parcubacteria group bacterium GW2011_GWC2_49_9]OGY85030.1 MAG: hypothetical protein A2898_02775 [Candidatus Kerfeldbacteria bacterium RIFCSPLOWO2_01_FULL_48_11]HCJ52486.1 hypothetical protein [Candidatus Kerfeldbacteria bacterium]HCM67955.1 hypothetical protein [Candidatus Kerfeldbacteria bacterium]